VPVFGLRVCVAAHQLPRVRQHACTARWRPSGLLPKAPITQRTSSRPIAAHLERLRATAAEVFSERGLDAPLEIAVRAGVSISTLYNLWGSITLPLASTWASMRPAGIR
jgi:hypothetical protein